MNERVGTEGRWEGKGTDMERKTVERRGRHRGKEGKGKGKGTDMVRCGAVRCGSDSSTTACCTAGPSSNLGCRRQALYRADAMRTTRVVLYE